MHPYRVTWKDIILVCGGEDRDAGYTPVHYACPSIVYYHKAGEWHMKEITGDLPRDHFMKVPLLMCWVMRSLSMDQGEMMAFVLLMMRAIN